ncbi:MAG: M28 family peptidase [Bacteroidales bacterium]|nr:M28 family peptidase [Bacteroidales bacterium]
MTKIRNYFLIFFLTVCVPAAAQHHASVSPFQAERVLDRDSVRTSVEFLCSPELGGRATATEGSRNTAYWLENQFLSMGIQPLNGAWMHGFVTRDGVIRNVLGLIPGYAHPGRYIVLMAHFDNLGILGGRFFPGADANASGVAALLQLTRMFSYMNSCQKQYRHSLLVVALDGKEKNLAGSERLWREIVSGQLLDPATGEAVSPSQIDMVVNLDQLGSTLAPLTKDNGRYLIMLSEESTGRRNTLERINMEPGFGFELGYDYYGSKDFTKLFYRHISDQRVFLENNIPSVMFTSGITYRNNKPEDNPESLDYDILTSRIRLIFHWLDKIL